jgi:hypothetical protein
MSREQLSLLGGATPPPESEVVDDRTEAEAPFKCCDSCGGRLDVDPAPANAQGCACAIRREARAQRASIERLALAGTVDAQTAAALANGTWVPWVP